MMNKNTLELCPRRAEGLIEKAMGRRGVAATSLELTEAFAVHHSPQ